MRCRWGSPGRWPAGRPSAPAGSSDQRPPLPRKFLQSFCSDQGSPLAPMEIMPYAEGLWVPVVVLRALYGRVLNGAEPGMDFAPGYQGGGCAVP